MSLLTNKNIVVKSRHEDNLIDIIQEVTNIVLNKKLDNRIIIIRNELKIKYSLKPHLVNYQALTFAGLNNFFVA